MLELITVGFSEIASLECILLIAVGVVVGIIFGSIPGLSATMAIALCLPMTYGMAPISGMASIWHGFINRSLYRRHFRRPGGGNSASDSRHALIGGDLL